MLDILWYALSFVVTLGILVAFLSLDTFGSLGAGEALHSLSVPGVLFAETSERWDRCSVKCHTVRGL